MIPDPKFQAGRYVFVKSTGMLCKIDSMSLQCNNKGGFDWHYHLEGYDDYHTAIEGDLTLSVDEMVKSAKAHLEALRKQAEAAIDRYERAIYSLSNHYPNIFPKQK